MMEEGQEQRSGVSGWERLAFGVSVYMCECIHCTDQALFLYVFSYVYMYQLHISASKEVEGGNQAHFPFELS